MSQKFAIDPQEFFQEIDVRAFVHSVWRRKLHILLITFLCMAVAILGVLGMPAKNVAETSVQIEPELSTAGEESHIDTEIQVIVSWPVVSEAVDVLGVNAFVYRKTEFLSRAITPIRECIWGKIAGGEKASVAHTIKLGKLSVPESYNGKTLTLKVIDNNRYALFAPYRRELLTGRVGTVERGVITTADGKKEPIQVRIDKISAKEGEEYAVVPLAHDDYVRALQKSLEAERVGVRNSNGIIDIRFTADDPEFATRFLDILVNVYAQKSLQRSARGKINALENMRLRNEQVEKKLKKAEEDLEAFREQENAINLNQETTEKIRLVIGLDGKIGDLESQKADLLTTRTESNPSVLAIKEQIISYQRQIDDIEATLSRMPEVERKLYQLTREVSVNKQIYVDNIAAINKLTNEVAAITGYARVLNQAVLQKNTIFLKVIAAGFLGGAFAVFCSLAAILIRNTAFFAIVRTPDMLRIGAKLPVIASIPRSSGVGKKHKGYLIDTGDSAARVLKDLESKIKYITHGADNNVLMLTSDVENQGKSFVASNFALLSAEHRRTLLIDADAVKGSLHFNFATLKSPGFSDLIVGEASLDQVLTNPIEGKLWFIPSGTELPSHNLLHDSEKLKSLMRMLSSRFDLIIVDYPAVMSQIDNPELLSFAGTIFLVVRQGESASRVKRFLSKYPQGLAKVSAIIFNDVVEGR